MKRAKYPLALAGIAFALMAPGRIASADQGAVPPGQLPELTAEWRQWSYSIPTPVNPTLDTTGENCMVGQRGEIWFLAGVLFGGTATRSCSVPEGVTLFFPVINSDEINSPNICGQDAHNVTVKEAQAMVKSLIDAVQNISVTVDGKDVKKTLLRRVQSQVYAVTLPEDNVFDQPCIDAGLGNVPAGVYSPAVDDGYYASVPPLAPGTTHIIHLHAESGTDTEDLTYNLTVVPVLLQ